MPLTDYQVTGRIAEGRFGTVFAARQLSSGRAVAVKKIRARRNLPGLDFDPWYKSAERERDVLVDVKHTNIVELLDHYVEPGAAMAVLVYPYLSWDLATVLEHKKPLSEEAVKGIARMLLRGVAFLHEHRVVHRDLKPPNMLMDGQTGQLKVADFGSARFLPSVTDLERSSFQTCSESGLMTRDVCTRWYKSPEMLFGSVNYSFGVDLWAAGCTVAEMMLGNALFPGGSDLEQLCLIFQALGTPDEEDWPGVRKLPDYHKVSFKQRARGARRNGALEAQGFQQKKSASRVARPEIPDLGSFSPMSQSLAWAFLPLNPGRRLGAAEALLHEFFQSAESDPTALLEGLPESGHHQSEANEGPISPIGLSEFGSDCSALSFSGAVLEPVTVETTTCGLWDDAEADGETDVQKAPRTPTPPRDGVHKFKLKR
ncbi:unnamed protein product [Effrenium voratum]|nr:unnamed protein product [Effrenium voratum]